MSNSQKVLTRDEVEKLMGEHVKIPEGYTEIERGAFRDGADIVHLEIPASIKKSMLGYGNFIIVKLPGSM